MLYKSFIFLLVAVSLNLQSFASIKNATLAVTFNSSDYSYHVSEDVALGTPAGAVSALDNNNFPLTYTIKSGNTNNTFSIDPSSGLITVAKSLNHHTQSQYMLVVGVIEPGGLSDEAPVNITVDAGAAADFTNITWSSAVNQPFGTHEVHGEVVNGKLYIFGGYDVQKRPGYIPTKRAFVFDPVAKTWSSIADLPHTPKGANYGGVTHMGVTTDGTDIYFAGGYPCNSNGTAQAFGTKQAWKYNVASNTYTALPNLPMEVATGQLRYLQGKLHYMGGANLSRNDITVHYALDLDNLAAGWKSLAPILNATNHPGSAVYGGKIYFLGGAHHQDNASIKQKTVEVYDPGTNSWKLVADLPLPLDHIASSVVVFGDRILVLGGESKPNVKSKQVLAYSPANNEWTSLTPMSSERSAGVAAVLNGVLYFTGGNFSNVNNKGTPAGKSTTETETLSPVADATVRGGTYDEIHYGTDPALNIKGSPSASYTRYSYLKFSLADVDPGIISATLRLYGHNISNSASINISVYGVNNDSWTEKGIEFHNAPAPLTSSLSSKGVSGSAKYYDFDITNFVKSQFAGDKVVSLMVKDPNKTDKNIVFNSRENAQNKPQLVIKANAQNKKPGLANFNEVSNSIISLPENAGDLSSVLPGYLIKTKVYPNPVNKTFNVEFDKNDRGIYKLQIVDEVGKIYELGTSELMPGVNNIKIDVSKLSLHPGVYFLRIHSDANQTQIIKFIKE